MTLTAEVPHSTKSSLPRLAGWEIATIEGFVAGGEVVAIATRSAPTSIPLDKPIVDYVRHPRFATIHEDRPRAFVNILID